MSTTTEKLIARQRRRSRGTLLAWAVVAALAAETWTDAVQLGWITLSQFWSFLPAAVAVYLLVRWVRRVWHLDKTAIAQELDQHWQLEARIESAVELAAEDSAVAVAQRVDTAKQLESKRPVGTPAWLAGIAAVVLLIAVMVAEKWALSQLGHGPKAAVAVDQAQAPAAIAPTPLPPPEPLKASIVWIAPAKLSQAKSGDEVAVLAAVKSNKGFRAMTLEVALNGDRGISHGVDANTLAILAKPESSQLKQSLFLDETGGKPYDFVFYHLRGEANFPPAYPAVFSPLQYVEIVPPGNDRDPVQKFSAEALELLRRLLELRRAQAELIETRFALAHADSDSNAPELTSRNAKAASDQPAIGRRVGEARTLLVQMKAPDAITSDLAQAETAMEEAGKQLIAADYSTAATFQSRALTSLAEAERLFRQFLETQKPPEPPSSTPKPGEPGLLEARDRTPAGRLELLARRQQENNRRLQEGSDTAAVSLIAAEQASIAREMERLIGLNALIEPVQKVTANAGDFAAEAARHLGLNDAQAAREPAAETLALLQHAVEIQEAEGRKTASALLEQVRNDLNEAGRLADPSAQRARQQQIVRQVRDEAQRQQRQGSAEAAQRLSTLSQRVEEAGRNPSPPPDAKPTESNSTASATGNDAAAGDAARPGGSGLRVYEAELQPLPGAEKSQATGTATITVQPDKSVARISVTFDRLSSAETGAFLAIGDAAGKNTAVLQLGTGAIARTWAFAPAAGKSREALIAALEAGEMRIQIDTAAFTAGELGGQFKLKSRRESGPPPPPTPPGPRPVPYTAEMWPLPEMGNSRASGSAVLILAADKLSSVLQVNFDQLSSAQTGAFLKVKEPTENLTPVLTVGVGRITGKSWRFEPTGKLSRDDLVGALQSGRLIIEIDTVSHPSGELRAPFLTLTATGGLAGTGEMRSQPNQAAGVAMPGLHADAGIRGPLIDLSTAAAESQVALAPDNSLAQTIRQLKSAAKRLSSGDNNASNLALIQLAAEKAQWLSGDPKLAEAARSILEKAGGNLDHPESIDPVLLKALSDQAEGLIGELEKTRPPGKRDSWLRRFTPEEIDPDYRKPVDDYFEKLSREGAAR